MPKPIRISTPPPIFEKMARSLRIPKTRQKELFAWAEEAWRRVDAEELPLTKIKADPQEMPKNASAA
jgi:hypothetical protein